MDRIGEILDKHHDNGYFASLPGMDQIAIMTSMDEYAKEQAIAFAEYLIGEGWQQYDGADRWINTQEGNAVLETKQLYEKFTNQQHGKL